MRRIAAAVVVSVMCAGALAACSPSEPDMPGMTASSTTSESPEPTSTPTPTSAGPSDLSDPALGIVFTDFPRDQEEQVAAAIEAYMLFETEFWKALTTNVVPPGPWAVASDEAIAWIQGQVGPNSANGVRAGGTMRTSTSLVSADAANVVLDVCADLTDVTFVESDGTTRPAVGSGQPATDGTRLTLVPGAGSSWRVETYELTGTC